MPITITEDLVLGAKFTIERTGGTLVRIFLVEGLNPSSQTLAAATAVTDSTTGFTMPRYAQQHPTVPVLFVSKVEVDPLKNSKTKAKVTVTYSSPEVFLTGGTKIRINGTLVQELRNVDPNGNPLQVKYTDDQGVVQTNNVALQVPVPHTILEFERIEANSPLGTAQSMQGAINSGTWQNGAPKTWQLRELVAETLGSVVGSAAGGFLVRYVFEYDPLRFIQLAFYQDPITNRFPSNVSISDNNDHGIFKFQPIAVDFNRFGLPNAY